MKLAPIDSHAALLRRFNILQPHRTVKLGLNFRLIDQLNQQHVEATIGQRIEAALIATRIK